MLRDSICYIVSGCGSLENRVLDVLSDKVVLNVHDPGADIILPGVNVLGSLAFGPLHRVCVIMANGLEELGANEGGP
jgi:hypothetical protein